MLKIQKEEIEIKNKYLIILILVVLVITFYFIKGEDQNSTLKNYETEEIKDIKLLKDQENNAVTELQQTIISQGFEEEIEILLTIDLIKDEIKSIDILKENESDGYGSYISEDWFQERFAVKKTSQELETVKMSAKNDNEIVAVTGATLSSIAVVQGVNLGLENYKKIKEEVDF